MRKIKEMAFKVATNKNFKVVLTLVLFVGATVCFASGDVGLPPLP